MFFEELIEQHRVHCVVAHGVDLAVLFAHHQVGVHRSHFLSDQTKLRRVFGVALVVEHHWLERQDRFASFVHWLDLLLEPARGADRAKRAGGVDQYWYGIDVLRLYAANVADKAAVAHVRTRHSEANTDNVTGVSYSAASRNAQGRVLDAGGVVKERVKSGGRVGIANDVVRERRIAGGRVLGTFCVGKKCERSISSVVGADGITRERINTGGRIITAFGVAKKRIRTGGRVAVAGGIVLERRITVGRIAKAGGVVQERLNTGGRVAAAFGVARKRIKTVGRVAGAGGVAQERERSICRVADAGRVGKKRERSVGGVLGARGVAQESPGASGCILVCRVEQQRAGTDTCAEAAVGKAQERIYTVCRIVDAGGTAKKGTLPLCRVAAGITAVGRGTDPESFRGRHQTKERQCDQEQRDCCFELND